MSSSASITDATVPDGDELGVEPKVVLILCGLIGSGKSTFAQSLETHFPHFRRCNQDDLGDRRRVERLARESLDQGLSVCIDRTNFNAPQRSHWIEIAREFPGTLIWVIVFDTPYEICAARLRERTSHPTIKSPQQGLSLLQRFAADFQAPEPYEGYDCILYVKPSEQISPIYSRSDISTLLHRVRDSSLASRTPSSSSSRARGNSFRGRRAWGRPGQSQPYSYRGRGSFSPSGSFVGGFRGWSNTAFRGGNTGENLAGGEWRHRPRGVSLINENASSNVAGEGTAHDPYTVD